jgi:hypothetical protein
MTIKTIIAALVGLVSGWQPNNTISNDITDAMLALGVAHELGANGAFLDAAEKLVSKAAAGEHNLNSGQAAVVASRDGLTLLLVKTGGAAATAVGL